MALSEAPGSAGALVQPEYSNAMSHKHVKAGGGVETHSHKGAIAGHKHSANDPLNDSGVALLPMPSAPVAGGKAGGSGNPQGLIDWYEGGADGQIDWGSPGDFNQCVDVASNYMDEDQADGFCQLRHIGATGMTTAEHTHEEGKAASDDDDSSKPYGDVEYADPGYQADGKKRYPLDTEKHIRAAWGYINQEDNAKKYSPGNLAKVKANIRAAMKKIGAEVSEDGKEFVAISLIENGQFREAQAYLDAIGTEGAKSASISIEAFLMTQDSFHIKNALHKLEAKGAPTGNMNAHVALTDKASLISHMKDVHKVDGLAGKVGLRKMHQELHSK